jgi:hypothetical protein
MAQRPAYVNSIAINPGDSDAKQVAISQGYLQMSDNSIDEVLLARLIDRAKESIDVEHKCWIDLSSDEVRANTARHIAALANTGGGWLIFGLDDNGGYSEPYPENIAPWDQDAVNGIVKRYLSPSFECKVYRVTSKVNGQVYPVMRVPSHGVVPICSKADGPQRERKVQGINQGVHYIRRPGPESAPISSPDQWRDLIHRCMINERDALLSSISRLFDRPVAVTAPPPLEELLDEGINLWRIGQLPQGWRVDPKKNHVAFAFRFTKGDGAAVADVPLQTLRCYVGEASNAASSEARFGWAPFQALGGISDATVSLLRDGREALASDQIAAVGRYVAFPELWRIARDGRGIQMLAYHEDSSWVEESVNSRVTPPPWGPGRFLSPRLQARIVFALVAFVRLMAQCFPDAARVELVVDYQGLVGRQLKDTSILYRWHGSSSVEGRRLTVETSPEALIGGGTAEAVAKLLSGITILFDGNEVDADFILSVIREN